MKRKHYKRVPAWIRARLNKLEKSTLERQLCETLIHHAGERGYEEGAVDTLNRIIRERDLAFTRLALSQLEQRRVCNFQTPW